MRYADVYYCTVRISCPGDVTGIFEECRPNIGAISQDRHLFECE